MTQQDTILIVEDSKLAIAMYKRALQKAGIGYKIDVAEDLETAKAKFARGNIVAVVTDNDFRKAPKGSDAPDAANGSGIELVRYIRQDVKETLPIVFATGGGNITTPDNLCNAAGIAQKPIISETLTQLDGATAYALKRDETSDIVAQYLAQKLPKITAAHSVQSV